MSLAELFLLRPFRIVLIQAAVAQAHSHSLAYSWNIIMHPDFKKLSILGPATHWSSLKCNLRCSFRVIKFSDWGSNPRRVITALTAYVQFSNKKDIGFLSFSIKHILKQLITSLFLISGFLVLLKCSKWIYKTKTIYN